MDLPLVFIFVLEVRHVLLEASASGREEPLAAGTSSIFRPDYPSRLLDLPSCLYDLCIETNASFKVQDLGNMVDATTDSFVI